MQNINITSKLKRLKIWAWMLKYHKGIFRSLQKPKCHSNDIKILTQRIKIQVLERKEDLSLSYWIFTTYNRRSTCEIMEVKPSILTSRVLTVYICWIPTRNSASICCWLTFVIFFFSLSSSCTFNWNAYISFFQLRIFAFKVATTSCSWQRASSSCLTRLSDLLAKFHSFELSPTLGVIFVWASCFLWKSAEIWSKRGLNDTTKLRTSLGEFGMSSLFNNYLMP